MPFWSRGSSEVFFLDTPTKCYDRDCLGRRCTVAKTFVSPRSSPLRTFRSPARTIPSGKSVACSADVFFGRAICSRKRHVETSRREVEMGRVIFFSPPPPPFPSFAFAPLAPTVRKGYYFYSPQSSTVIKSKMAATTTLRTRTRFRPSKIRLHCRLGRAGRNDGFRRLAAQWLSMEMSTVALEKNRKLLFIGNVFYKQWLLCVLLH